MNFLRRLSFLAGVALAAAVPALEAAGTIDIKNIIQVDRFGDGTMAVEFKLSASEWGAWKQNYGDRPDLVRRNLRQRFARYELGDFKLEKDEMERTATATLEMRGGVKLRRDGAHEIQISKTMRRVSNTPNEWIFTSVSQANPYEPLMTETTHIILPPEATNIRHVGAGTANHALVYDVPPTGGSKRGLLFSGMAILGVGLALAAAGYLPRKDPRRRS